jgi:hypothetical protein
MNLVDRGRGEVKPGFERVLSRRKRRRIGTLRNELG